MTTIDELLAAIFDRKQHPLYPDMEKWVRNSRRFRAFALAYQSKIRSKLKNAHDEGGMQDLRAELETAARLLREERFALDYEKYAASKKRGPDFTVTFKTHTLFNVEVRRIRNFELDGVDMDARLNKLMNVLLDKVGQMPPSIINVLWLMGERELSQEDVERAALTLRQLAEQKTEEVFTRRGFEGAADFLRHYHRLSGIVLPQGDKQVVWLNSIARHPVPPDIVTALQRLERIDLAE